MSPPRTAPTPFPSRACAAGFSAYDGGDCCSCDCGTIVTETEVNGTIYVETVYNGTVTVETTFPNGTTVVYTDETDMDVYWTCGEHGAGYACVDPSSSCVDDDDYTAMSTGDDDIGSQCYDQIMACFGNAECYACVDPPSSTTSTGDDNIEELCPLESSETCSAVEDFYCCAIEETMAEGCTDNSELVTYFGESTNVARSARPEVRSVPWVWRQIFYDKLFSRPKSERRVASNFSRVRR